MATAVGSLIIYSCIWNWNRIGFVLYNRDGQFKVTWEPIFEA